MFNVKVLTTGTQSQNTHKLAINEVESLRGVWSIPLSKVPFEGLRRRPEVHGPVLIDASHKDPHVCRCASV
jgi:hypothetical protein